MRKQIICALLAAVACIAFRQNAWAGNGAQLYARAESIYKAADYVAAQPAWQAAARALDAECALDSAARAYYFGFKCDYQRGDLGALKDYRTRVLVPAMRRINTTLAEAYIEESAAAIAFKEYELQTWERHLVSAFESFEKADVLHYDEAIANRSFLGVAYVALGRDIDSAVAFAQYAVDLALAHHDPCATPLAYAYHSLGIVLYLKEDLKGSLVAYQLAYQILEANLPPRHPHLVNVNGYLAEMHAEMGHPAQALHYARRAIDLCRDQDPYTQARAYFQYGEVLSELSLPQQARFWHAKARDIYRGAPPEYRMSEYLVVSSMLDDLIRNGEVAAATSVLDTLEALDDLRGGSSRDTRASLSQSRGTVYRLQGRDAESLQAFRKALALTKLDFDESLFTYRTIYQQLVETFLDLGQVDSARHYHRLAEPYVVEEGQEALEWVVDFRLLGIGVATAAGDYVGAGKELGQLLDRYEPTLAEDKVMPHLARVIAAARGLYAAAPGPRTRALLLRSVRFSDRLLTEDYALLAAERWTPGFIEELRDVYTDAAFAAAEACAAGAAADESAGAEGAEAGAAPGAADWCALAVRYADLPRALGLRRRGAELAGALRAGLPDSLLERGHYLQRRRAALQHSEMDSSLRARETRALREASAAYESELQLRHPQYYRSVLSPLALDVAALRRRAEDAGALYVSYLVDSARGRALVCAVGGSDRDELRVVAHGPEQVAAIDAFKAELAGQRSERLGELGHGLYDHYVAPVLRRGDRERAIAIAGDGELAGLPFAALLTEAPAPGSAMATWPWLGLRYRVSYVDALASAQAPAATGRRAGSADGEPLAIACVAPGFEEGGAAGSRAIATGLGGGTGAPARLTRTPWTLALGEALGERYGATVVTGAAATERALAGAYAAHDVIHLGTHAFLDADDPLRSYFALTPTSAERADDGRLFAYEVYGLEGGARLAVLPACHSGAGAFRAGEGTLSLATAFRNSGCPTVVQSFWSIDDQQTNALLGPFYAHLAAGEPVAGALAAAQREYLAAAPEPLQHPYYWAGLAVVGPEVRFGESRPTWPYWLLGGLALVCITIFSHRPVHLRGAAR